MGELEILQGGGDDIDDEAIFASMDASAANGLQRDTSEVSVDAELIEGFVEEYLLERYDEPCPTPDCHREWWAWYCSDETHAVLAAPRSHAKSTAITHACTLAEALFGAARFFLIISSVEDVAKQFLGDIKTELLENERIREDFGVEGLLKDTETDIICRCTAGIFRIKVRGAEQKLRGTKWRAKRPDRVIMDDGEDDEQVESKERRTKFRRWFQNALLPVGSDSCKYRVIGTVLHLDSMLERLLKSQLWHAKRYAAHDEDYENVLWPEKFPIERLLAIRSQYVSEGNPEGYAQEYLNNPIDTGTSYFQRPWFREMTDAERHYVERQRTRKAGFYVTVDLSITKADHGDWTVFGIACATTENELLLTEVSRNRLDSLEIVEEFFRIQKRYEPELFIVEAGAIEKAIMPILRAEMVKRGVYLAIRSEGSSKDKMTRARGIQKVIRAHGMAFDTEADWWPEFLDEVTRFPKAKHDDQVDVLAMFGLVVDQVLRAPTDAEMEQSEYDSLVSGEGHTYESPGWSEGANEMTGY